MKRPPGFDERRSGESQKTERTESAGADSPAEEHPQLGWFRAKRRAERSQEVHKRIADRRQRERQESVWDADRGVTSRPPVSEQPTIDLDRVSGKLSSLRQREANSSQTLNTSRERVRIAQQQLRWANKQKKRQERKTRRRFTEDRRKRLRPLLLSLGTVAVLALVVCVLVFTPIMSIRSIEVSGNERVATEDITQALSSVRGEPLALVGNRDIEDALSQFPLIQEYSIEIVPPSTLTVKIRERQPVLAVKRDGVFDQYDPAGVLVTSSKEQPDNVPLVTGDAANTMTQAFQTTAQVMRDMPTSLRDQVRSATASSAQDVTLTLDSGIQIFWGNTSDAALKAVVAERMLVALKDQSIQRIDVSAANAPVYQ